MSPKKVGNRGFRIASPTIHSCYRLREDAHRLIDTLFKIGLAKTLIAFADIAAAWQKLVRDYRTASQEEENNIFAPFNSIMV